VNGSRLAALAAFAGHSPGVRASPVSTRFVLVDQQVLETPRHVVEFAVDEVDVAGEARRRRLGAENFANETVVLSQNVFQAPAEVSKLRQLLRPHVGVVGLSLPF